MARLEGKELEGARASALKAMAINPDLPRKSSRIASNLAAVFMSTNDKMHAMPLLRQALEQDPENAEARELLANAEKE
jgi:cytochrome c-type biogenesis protein CcmH/NrfG